MARVHTHYDNLKVTRDAPPEVIRAAYQALAMKYHPDRNPGDVAAQRVMQLINAAHETLGDPIRREQHDRWIRSMENGDAPLPMEFAVAPVAPGVHPAAQSVRSPDVRAAVASAAGAPSGGGAARPAGPGEAAGAPLRDSPLEPPIVPPIMPPGARGRPGRVWLRNALGVIAVAGAMLLFLYDELAGNAPSRPGPAAQAQGGAPSLPAGANPPAARPGATVPGYVRPARTPGGEAWPEKSDYVPGFKVLFDGGVSTITLENRSPSDLYVKLYALRDARSFAVRWAFVKAGESFTLREVRAGRYDVRYRDMDTGAVTRSDPFELEERTVAEGTRVTNVKIALSRPPVSASGSASDTDF